MFWDNFKWYCKLYDLTPHGLCKLLGFSSATATQWKKGAISEKNTLLKISTFFNISVNELINGDTFIDKKLLLAYHSSSSAIRDAVKKLLDI